jgi:hypothetical protein
MVWQLGLKIELHRQVVLKSIEMLLLMKKSGAHEENYNSAQVQCVLLALSCCPWGAVQVAAGPGEDAAACLRLAIRILLEDLDSSPGRSVLHEVLLSQVLQK